MFRKLRTVAGVIAIATLSVIPAHAGSSTARYVVSPDGETGVMTGSFYIGDGETVGVTTGSFSVGEIEFWHGVPSKVLQISVQDRNGPGVGVRVCQENGAEDDSARFCGDGGDDVAISYCSEETPKNVDALNFKPNSWFQVEIDFMGTSCSTVGTAGTVTVDW